MVGFFLYSLSCHASLSSSKIFHLFYYNNFIFIKKNLGFLKEERRGCTCNQKVKRLARSLEVYKYTGILFFLIKLHFRSMWFEQPLFKGQS
ncbi:hypothetical protein Hdeb2414_s0406g00887041 [Helianthus debilis subsp. tardiflorus]